MELNMTVGELKNKVLQALSKNEEIDITKYEKRIYGFIDTAQKEVAQYANIVKHFFITQNNSGNNLLKGDNFKLCRHQNVDIVTSSVNEAGAYYFAVDDECEVLVESLTDGIWTTIKTISNIGQQSPNGEFTVYKGIIEVSGDIRIRFGGEYPYNYKDVALFASKYSSAEKIPDYREYVTHTLPADFSKLLGVAKKTTGNDYLPTTNYRPQEPHSIVLSYNDNGEFQVTYQAIPKTLYYNSDSDKTPDDYELEVPLNSHEVVAKGVEQACLKNNYDLRFFANYFAEYQGWLSSLTPTFQSRARVITTGLKI